MESLRQWQPGELLPEDEVALLPAVIAAADDAMRPAEVREFALLIERFFDWADMLGIGKFPDDPDAKQERFTQLAILFAEDLEHLPPDILEDALRQVRRRHKWAKMPTPADILECADEELSRRRQIKRRAEAAMAAARRETQRLPAARPRDIYTPEQIAAAESWAKLATSRIEEPAVRRDAGALRQIGRRVGFTAEELERARDAAAAALAKRAQAPAEAAE